MTSRSWGIRCPSWVPRFYLGKKNGWDWCTLGVVRDQEKPVGANTKTNSTSRSFTDNTVFKSCWKPTSADWDAVRIWVELAPVKCLHFQHLVKLWFHFCILFHEGTQPQINKNVIFLLSQSFIKALCSEEQNENGCRSLNSTHQQPS